MRVWGDVIDRAGADLLEVQTAIATALASAVIGQLLPLERQALARRDTRDSAAYDLYLRGRFMVSRLTNPANIRVGMDFYRRALARDSNFALAEAGIAQAWEYLADNWLAPVEAMLRAREAANRALRIDSTVALAVVILGSWALQMDYAFARAESLARRAIEFSPRLPEAHLLLAEALLLQGKLDGGLRESEEAWKLDSLSNIVAAQRIGHLFTVGRFPEIRALIERPRERDPAASVVLAVIDATALLALRECQQARETILRIPQSERTPRSLRTLGVAAACTGRRDEARESLLTLEALARRTYVRPTFIADIHAALEERDEAFVWLERACDARDWEVLHLLAPLWWRDHFARIHGSRLL